jgi:hypothetical protein
MPPPSPLGETERERGGEEFPAPEQKEQINATSKQDETNGATPMNQ